jgi:hypothetical protein
LSGIIALPRLFLYIGRRRSTWSESEHRPTFGFVRVVVIGIVCGFAVLSPPINLHPCQHRAMMPLLCRGALHYWSSSVLEGDLQREYYLNALDAFSVKVLSVWRFANPLSISSVRSGQDFEPPLLLVRVGWGAISRYTKTDG